MQRVATSKAKAPKLSAVPEPEPSPALAKSSPAAKPKAVRVVAPASPAPEPSAVPAKPSPAPKTKAVPAVAPAPPRDAPDSCDEEEAAEDEEDAEHPGPRDDDAEQGAVPRKAKEDAKEAAMDIQPSGAAMDIDFESLVQQADPLVVQNRQAFQDIGEHCRTMEQAHSDLGCIVRRLRDQGIVLADFASFNVAKMYIQYTHRLVSQDTLDKYTCHLRQLLAMPEAALPDHISITAPLPQWITAGDDVVGIDSENHWWHAVALEITKKGVSVYWVGFEPLTLGKRSRYKGNPEWVPMSMLRAHDAKSDYVKTGPHKKYDVAWIKEQYPPMPKTFEDSIMVGSSSDENSDDEAAAAKADEAAAAKAEKAAAAKAAKSAAAKAAAAKAAAAKAAKDKAAAVKRVAEPRIGSSRKRSATNAADDGSSVLSVHESGNDESDSSDGDDDTEDDDDNDDNNDDDEDDADDDGYDNDGESMGGIGDDGSSSLHSADAASAPDCPLGNDADAQVKFRAMLNVFHDVEAAIVCLMGLDSGLPVHLSLFADMSKKLISVARFSAVHYGNTAFDTLASETLRELADYQGQQKPKLPHTGNIEP